MLHSTHDTRRAISWNRRTRPRSSTLLHLSAIVLCAALTLFPLVADAAIARDSSATFSGISGTTGTLASAYAIGSPNNVLVVCDINTKNAVGNVTSITENGTAMTLADQNAFVAAVGVLYVYVAANVTSPVAIVEHQTDGTQGNYGVIDSLTGGSVTQPDSHTPGTGSSITGFTSGTTPVAANSWAIQCGGDSTTATSPGTGSNTVQAWSASSGMWLYDSNGPVTAGSNYAMQTTGPTANYSWDEITIAPVASAAASFFEGPQWNVQFIL